jgi:hypothetical protein
LPFGQTQDVLRGFLEPPLFVLIDILSFALSEAIDEKRLVSTPEKDDCPITFRFSLTLPGDPLLDNSAA